MASAAEALAVGGVQVSAAVAPLDDVVGEHALLPPAATRRLAPAARRGGEALARVVAAAEEPDSRKGIKGIKGMVSAVHLEVSFPF